MGLFDRILERFRGKPAPEPTPGLFTARSPNIPPELDVPPGGRAATPPEDDLWDRADDEPIVPDELPELLDEDDLAPAEPAPAPEVAALDELTPPAAEPETPVEPLWDDDASAPEPPSQPAPVPLLFAPPTVEIEPEPEDLAPEPATDDEGRTMRVHDGRLDRRPGPIRMTPSEAIALAQDGPQALRRARPHAES